LTPTPTILDTFYSAGVILTFLAFASANTPMPGRLDRLGEHSFGVYLIHTPVLELLARASYHLVPVLLAYQFFFQSLLIIAGIGVPLLLMTLVKRSPARPYYSYLF